MTNAEEESARGGPGGPAGGNGARKDGALATAGVPAALLLLVAAVYSGTYRHEFTGFDDDLYVTENRHVLRGITLRGIRWAFTSFDATNWHPLTWISHMLDVSLFGVHAGSHLLVNAALHGLNSVLLFVVLRRATGTLWRSAAVAALFAVHPLHVESVAWVAQRKDVLCSLFFFLSLLAYVRYAERPVGRRLLAVAVLYALGLLAKPMIVTLPFLLLLLDAWPLGRIRTARFGGRGDTGRFPAVALRDALLEKVPLLFLSVLSSVVTYAAQARGGAVAPLKSFPFPMRAGNAVVSYVGYAVKVLWPSGLAAYYPHPGYSIGAVKVAASIAVLSGVSLLALRTAGSRPWLATGWFWFLGMLVPVIGIVQVGGQGMADRYVYLPVVGVFLAVVWGAGDLVPAFRGRNALLAAAGVVSVSLLGAAARVQAGYWKDGVALFTRAIAVTRPNPVAQVNLGHAYAVRGRLEEAIPRFREALRILPDSEIAHNNLGVSLDILGRTDEAIAHLREAVRLWPGYGLAHANLAETLRRTGRTGEAIPHFLAAIRCMPGDGQAWFRAGMALEAVGRAGESMDLYRGAIAADPSLVAPRAVLGTLLAARGRPGEAIGLYEDFLRSGRENPVIRYNLGVALMRSGRVEEAAGHFREAANGLPGDPRPRVNLGLALDAAGRTEDAVSAYREALRIAPADGKAHNNLGAALAKLGWIDEASAHFAAAVRVDPRDGKAHYNLGQALHALGRREESRVHLAKAEALGTRGGALSEMPPALDNLTAADRMGISHGR